MPAIHYSSSRREGPFICLNCGEFPEALLESELFGHEKGAFTGATEKKVGKFEAANLGTIFLDEIGELNPSSQAKLLRILEGHPFERVGGHVPLKSMSGSLPPRTSRSKRLSRPAHSAVIFSSGFRLWRL